MAITKYSYYSEIVLDLLQERSCCLVLVHCIELRGRLCMQMCKEVHVCVVLFSWFHLYAVFRNTFHFTSACICISIRHLELHYTVTLHKNQLWLLCFAKFKDYMSRMSRCMNTSLHNADDSWVCVRDGVITFTHGCITKCPNTCGTSVISVSHSRTHAHA